MAYYPVPADRRKICDAFQEYMRIPLRIKEIENEIIEIIMFQDESRDTLKAAVWSQTGPSNTNRWSDIVGNAVIKANEIFGLRLEQLKLELEDLYEKKATVDHILMAVAPEERRVLELYFFARKRVVQIHFMVHLSLGGIYHVLDRCTRESRARNIRTPFSPQLKVLLS